MFLQFKFFLKELCILCIFLLWRFVMSDNASLLLQIITGFVYRRIRPIVSSWIDYSISHFSKDKCTMFCHFKWNARSVCLPSCPCRQVTWWTASVSGLLGSAPFRPRGRVGARFSLAIGCEQHFTKAPVDGGRSQYVALCLQTGKCRNTHSTTSIDIVMDMQCANACLILVLCFELKIMVH